MQIFLEAMPQTVSPSKTTKKTQASRREKTDSINTIIGQKEVLENELI